MLSAGHRTKRGRLVDEQTGLESLREKARALTQAMMQERLAERTRLI